MNILDLFSGIGGFSLGLERAGFETVAFCEIEEYPRSILKKHWPDVPIYKDVRELNQEVLENDGITTIDLICGGFPCQPFSVAGKQRGQEDDRHLWPEMLRLIREIEPSWIIGENVAGFITMALDDVLSDLESEGYTCQTFVIPACAVNAIHRRDRVWIVAYSDDKRLQGESITRSNGEIREKRGNKQFTGRGSSQDFKPIPIPTESPVRHRNDGLSNNMARLKALGNAVAPQIPELIGHAIMATNKGSTGVPVSILAAAFSLYIGCR